MECKQDDITQVLTDNKFAIHVHKNISTHTQKTHKVNIVSIINRTKTIKTSTEELYVENDCMPMGKTGENS